MGEGNRRAEAAAQELVSLGRRALVAEAEIINAISSSRSEPYITRALVKIGKPAVDLLIKALKELHWSNATRVVYYALAEIGDRRAVPAMLAELKNETDWDTRNIGIRNLVRLDAGRRKDIQRLVQELRSRGAINAEQAARHLSAAEEAAVRARGGQS